MYQSVRGSILGMGLLVCAACNAAEPPARTDVSESAARCGACHQGPLALTRRSPEDLVARITAIRDGAIAHPPVDVDLTSDAVVAELAQTLSGK